MLDQLTGQKIYIQQFDIQINLLIISSFYQLDINKTVFIC